MPKSDLIQFQLRIDRSSWGEPAPDGRRRRRGRTLLVVLALLAALGLAG